MDSVTQLALMSKAKKVFGHEGTFLAFPVTPLTYEPEDLRFSTVGEDGPTVARRLANIEAFSTLVNLIPEGEAWMPTETRFLWDECGHVLGEGVCANSTRTEEEERRYREAESLLRVTDADGLVRDSPSVVLYKQYKDAHHVVQEEFMEARVSAETSDDETVRRRWTELEEPAFRERLQGLERDWVLEGHRHAVEEAQSVFVTLGAKSPWTTWAHWKSLISAESGAQTGASSGMEIYPSSFAPSNALEEGMWKSFTLDRASIEALVAEAPPELRRRFSADGEKPAIESMSLEFSSAVVTRPWLDPELFRSRFWRLGDPAKRLSDGASPARGDCPAYVTAVVFARRIRVREARPQEPPGRPPEGRPQRPPLQWPPIVSLPPVLKFERLPNRSQELRPLDPKLLRALRPTLHLQPPERAVVETLARPSAAALRPHRAPGRSARAAPRPAVSPAGAALRPNLAGTLTTATIRAAEPPAVAVAGRPGTNRSASLRVSPAMLQVTAVPTFRRLPTLTATPASVSPPEPTSAPASESDDIIVLAFICKPLPKCPDPDLTLQW